MHISPSDLADDVSRTLQIWAVVEEHTGERFPGFCRSTEGDHISVAEAMVRESRFRHYASRELVGSSPIVERSARMYSALKRRVSESHDVSFSSADVREILAA